MSIFARCFGRQASPSTTEPSKESLPEPQHIDTPHQERGPVAEANAVVVQEKPSPDLMDTQETCKDSPQPTTPNSASSLAAMLTTRPIGSGVEASWGMLRDMNAEQVTECSPFELLENIRFFERAPIGSGSYGVVVEGTYQGLRAAFKVMLSPSLDRAALREVLLGPRMVHPHLVMTYSTRCAKLTNEYFDHLEGPRDASFAAAAFAAAGQRVLLPAIENSGDGFGDPARAHEGANPLPILHEVLHSLGAAVGQVVTLCVMEFCDRSTLHRAITSGIFTRHPRWPLRVSRRAMARTATEIARGMMHLHSCGVVHGDLKPANIMLKASSEDRRGFTVKVGDFGLAHLVGANTSLQSNTWGSIAYMAPEAFRGKVSHATDVWAFGVCLWEMLTGQRPYTGMEARDVVDSVKVGSLQLAWPQDAPLAAEMVALGRRCCAFDPAERPTFKDIMNEMIRIEGVLRQTILQTGLAEGGAAAAAAAKAWAGAAEAARRAGTSPGMGPAKASGAARVSVEAEGTATAAGKAAWRRDVGTEGGVEQ